MFDSILLETQSINAHREPLGRVGGSPYFWFFKRVFDVVVSLALVPALVTTALALVVLNPFFNRGSLFFVQERMGKHCKPFRAIKFRTMVHVAEIVRSHDDPIEMDRITVLGKFLRNSRLDEVPQIINVLKGDMSLIGPRPDYYRHASYFLEHVAGYRERHMVRPGISGLAQVNLGYAVGIEATAAKVNADTYYLANAGFRLEAAIFLETLRTVFLRLGA
jgi:lipopolysaccharide/colanic/teichoic acid biosynthesis glycosyltransferase